jgi:hypothetical protein
MISLLDPCRRRLASAVLVVRGQDAEFHTIQSKSLYSRYFSDFDVRLE